jgi:hypothetical protein
MIIATETALVHHMGRILLEALAPSYLIYLYECERNVLKWISCTIKYDRTLHFEITSDVTYNEAFEPPKTLNVHYIHHLPSKSPGLLCSTQNFRIFRIESK